MSRRTPLRVCTLRTTTSANSFAMMIGPSFPPSVGYSAGSCTSGRSARGPCGSAAMSSPPDESTGWSEEYGQVVGVDQRLVNRGEALGEFPAVRHPPHDVPAGDRVEARLRLVPPAAVDEAVGEHLELVVPVGRVDDHVGDVVPRPRRRLER